LISVLFANFAHPYYYPGMMPYYGGGFFFPFFFPFGFIFFIFIIFALSRLLFWPWGWRRGYWYRHDEAADILRQRYARGEITKDQFAQMMRDLEQRS
jgi:putative membrane protein